MLGLGALPWPWGEEILAGCFVARTLVRPTRLRQALGWAAAQAPSDRRRIRWRLARRLCANHGRFVSRSGLVGIRDPEVLRAHTVVHGGHHLAEGRGLILLGFHLGPLGAYLALRAAGHRVAWLGGTGGVGLWSERIRRRYMSPVDDLVFSTSGDARVRTRLLHRARQLVRAGDAVFVTADGLGKEVFTVGVPGGGIAVRAGWLALRRATGAPVLPVLSHLDGRTQVVTVHPALPPLDADPEADLERCRRALGELLGQYVRKFPDQCYSIPFPIAPEDRTPIAPR